ncbi:hypothetical protein N0V90_001637 [Kalmusia sp. IMI 367209]|nr:hypothetical protein N0V90_001637 [Kalmusia sp. IMI 367209]
MPDNQSQTPVFEYMLSEATPEPEPGPKVEIDADDSPFVRKLQPKLEYAAGSELDRRLRKVGLLKRPGMETYLASLPHQNCDDDFGGERREDLGQGQESSLATANGRGGSFVDRESAQKTRPRFAHTKDPLKGKSRPAEGDGDGERAVGEPAGKNGNRKN